MSAPVLARSPLDGVLLPDGLREVPFLAQVDLRVDPADAAALDGVAAVLGFRLPLGPTTAAGSEAGRVLWLGPDEWLVLAPPGAGARLEEALRSALGDAVGAVVDVSANRTTLELWGPRARPALESGCPIDLHPRSFGPGRVVQTLLGRANVILGQLTDEPRYQVLVRPSFAAYLAAWLTDALEGQDAD